MLTVQSAKGFYIMPRVQIDNYRDKMLYLFLFENANFIDSDRCNRGELITSKLKLEEQTGWSYAKIRGSLKRLEDMNLIKTDTLPMKSGTKIMINNYSLFQDLTNYKIKPSILRNEEIDDNNKPESNGFSKPIALKKVSKSIGKAGRKLIISKQNAIPNNKEKHKQNRNTITKALNKILKQNIYNTNKNNRFSNLSKELAGLDIFIQSYEDVVQFVEIIVPYNFPASSIDTKLFLDYLDCVRLARTSGKVSLLKIINFLAEVESYRIEIVESALRIHSKSHRDKNESYTIGIIRNITEDKSLKVDSSNSKPKVARRLKEREERMRSKGLLQKINENIEVDF